MALITSLIQAGVLIVCLIGLGLVSRRFAREVPFALHFCFVPFVLAAGLFCLEHYLALGQQPWVWLPLGALSFRYIWLERTALKAEPVLWYFGIGFLITLFWRCSFPDIDPVGERLADMDHLVSYYQGTRLPAEDVWMKGVKDNSYYVFQYYAGGLLHRFFGFGPGLTYHLSYCTLAGFGVGAIGAAVSAATASWAAGFWATIAVVIGGNGTSVLAPLMSHRLAAPPLAAMRFIGSFGSTDLPEHKNAFGNWFVRLLGASKVDAPMEYYSYVIMWGDYHPSLSSLAFLGLGILAIALAETAAPQSVTDRFCVIGAIFTAVFMLIGNAWTAPLQVALVAVWLIYRRWCRRGDTWGLVIAAWAAAIALMLPYLSEFAEQSRQYVSQFRWSDERPPIGQWLAVMFPAVLVCLAAIFRARGHRFALFVVILGFGAMAGTYLFYIHDLYGGVMLIFNSSLKWWPWVYTLVTMLGLIAVWGNRGLRWTVCSLLAITIAANAYIFARHWGAKPREHFGRLDGLAWFTGLPEHNAIYEQLKGLPRGVLLESPLSGWGDPGPALALFTGHYGLGDWTAHELLWHPAHEELMRLAESRDQFFTAKMDNPRAWLRSVVPGGVDYIVYLSRDNDRGFGIWPKINDAIKEDYDWKTTFDYYDARWGIWIRRK